MNDKGSYSIEVQVRHLDNNIPIETAKFLPSNTTQLTCEDYRGLPQVELAHSAPFAKVDRFMFFVITSLQNVTNRIQQPS